MAFLCGAGLEQTKAFLAAAGTDEANAAFEYLRHCEASGDFKGFSVAWGAAELRRFYRVGSP